MGGVGQGNGVGRQPGVRTTPLTVHRLKGEEGRCVQVAGACNQPLEGPSQLPKVIYGLLQWYQ